MFSPLCLEIAVLLLGLLMVLWESFFPEEDNRWMASRSALCLAVLFALSFFARGNPPPEAQGPLWHFYSADPAAMFFKRIALATTAIVLIMSLEYRTVLTQFLPLEKKGAGTGEFYALPVFTCAGLMFMASAVDFLFIFVSLELVTISFYVLVPFMRRNGASLEAGVKYLILGALSTGFFVYGVTWIFGVTGETNLAQISVRLATWHGSESALLFGLMLVLVGLGFKVAAAPFQLWVPDVYQGAPTPVTAFLSVGSKAAGFIVLMRVLQPFMGLPHVGPKVVAVVAGMAGLSLIYGNLAAMPQANFRRMLAYSSVAHAGYLLVAVASVSSAAGLMFGSAGVAVAYYLAGYLLMTLLSFLILILVAKHSRGGGEEIAHFAGLSKRSPFLAFGLLIAMLSLAGVPLTAGFYGKLLVFAAAWREHHFVLVGIGVVTVAAGFYYYLRVVAAMYWQEPVDDTRIEISGGARVVIGGLTAAIILFGVLPGPILASMRVQPPLPPGDQVAATR